MSESSNLHPFKRNVFSQNGEDGIINAIFANAGTTNRICCEFGAWDGIHFSNCRSLVVDGWTCVMIEGNTRRYESLLENYRGRGNVIAINKFVDVQNNSLDTLLAPYRFGDLDFLSIDIDGLDYEIFETLRSRPRVICIEVNAGHTPTALDRIPATISQHNIGQSLGLFVATAELKGYGLACYTGNAFFIREDVLAAGGWAPLSALDAYRQFLAACSRTERAWLLGVNKGWFPPYYQFRNPYLSRNALNISLTEAIRARVKGFAHRLGRSAYRAVLGSS